ncbi:MAG: hypothetical protein OER86_12460, partial [Phycisphaerae bacterium]|nr:hypothetical protein [Phycisphaerae bacterium]
EVTPNTLATNPRLKELIDEIVSLSTEFGILTEYTAFLAREGTDLSKKDHILAQACQNFWGRAVQSRTGYGSLNQTLNLAHQKSQAWANPRNDYLDDKLNRVSVTAVQQVNDRAFYRRDNQWVDSRVVDKLDQAKDARVIEFGSPDFLKLVRRLAGEGRQGCIALGGDVLMVIDGKPTLIKAPAPAAPAPQP